MKKQEIPTEAVWTNEFENLYILTYQTLFRHAKLIFNQDENIRELLVLTYMEAYQRGEQLQKEKIPLEWLMKRADFLAETKLGATREMLDASYAEEKMQSKEAKKEKFSELDETSLLLEIEERLGIVDEQGYAPDSSKTSVVFQGVVSLALLILAIVGLLLGIYKVKQQFKMLKEPFNRTFEDHMEKDMPDRDTVSIQLGDKAVVLSGIGKVLYSIPLEESEFAGSDQENPEIQMQEGWTYYLPCPERKDSQLSNVSPSLYHTLYRTKDEKEIEIIAQDVDNYTLWEGGIYVSQYNRVQGIDANGYFEKQTNGLYGTVHNDEIYLYDMLGRPLQTEMNGTIDYGDRIFTMSGNRIEQVEAAPRVKEHTTYYLKKVKGEQKKVIYRTSGGKEELFEERGNTIDSFCIVGDWLYYSAYIRQGGSGAHYSELYRKSLTENKKAELLGEEYKGRIFQMYYSEEGRQIYANYIPENWKSNYGVIAGISMTGQFSYLNDKAFREDVKTTGNDMLEFIMVQDGQVYCYWTDFYWEKGKDPVVKWRRVIAIPDHQRIVDGN